jgi:DNA-binding IclR family transcriptional regulator
VGRWPAQVARWETDTRIAALHCQGLPYSDIAARLGVPQQTVISTVSRLLKAGSLVSRRRAAISDPRVAALYREGVPLREIARRTGRPASTVSTIVQRMQVAGVLARRVRDYRFF